MRIVFTKHILLADLRSVFALAALLGCSAAIALQAPGALAATGGAAATGAAGTTATSTTSTSAASGTAAGGTPSGTSQIGKPTLATWFGPGFYGNQTACGQTMSPALIGVASRTLACGTLVQIGYHGRTLTVPVVDRGPYGHIGATWDLTAGAARALKIKETVHITTAIVGNLPNTPSLGEPLDSNSTTAGSAPSNSTGTAAVSASTTGGAAAAAS